ncbi:MAG: SAM-dependent methyltransferase, partial [Planctomycetaceae bacterium]
AANTLGAIAGALAISLLVIPQAGSRGALQLLTLLSGCSGLTLLTGVWWRQRAWPAPAGWRSHARTAIAILLAAACLVSVRLVPVIPSGLLAWGRHAKFWPLHEYLFVAEGLDSAIAVSNDYMGVVSFHVAGKVEASNAPSDMRTQRFLGHLPALAHGNPKRVLVICCGSGTTVGAILRHPTVERLTLCEIEAQVIEASRRHFFLQNDRALEDPRVEIIIDDGRHFLATTHEKFDIISTDPIHPWVRGAAALYTEEFYRLCRDHLNPGGIVTQWIPLYESSEAAVKCELATLLQVFPHAALWSGQGHATGYDIVALATLDEHLLQPGRVLVDLYRHPEVCFSLASVGYTDEAVLINSFAGYGSELQAWLTTAQINRDGNLRLQYLAGQTKAPDSAQQILDGMLASRQRRLIPETRPKDSPNSAGTAK